MRLSAIIVAVMLVCVTMTGNAEITDSPSGTVTPQLPAPAPDRARDVLRGMTLDEKIGQMMIAGFEGTEPGDQARVLIRDYRVGGLIVMGRNVKSSPQVLQLLNSLKRINEPNALPLFLSVDEEAGE